METMEKYVKIEVYIPEDCVEKLRFALNDAGLLRIGLYDHTVAVSEITGYWRPLEGANPEEGTVGEITCAREAKMEFRVRKDRAPMAVSVIRTVHPYEEPVFYVIPLWEF